MVWFLAVCPDDAKQDQVVYGAEFGVVFQDYPLSPFAPENFVSRDGFSRPVPRQPAHSPYSG